MLKFVLAMAGLVCGGVLASALGPRLDVAGVHPDFLMVVAVMGLLALGGDEGLLFAWAAGLTKDLFSTGALGANAFLFLLVGVGVQYLRARFRLDALPVVFVVTATAAVAGEAAYLLGMLASFPQMALWPMLGQLPLAAVYTAAAAVPVFVGLRLVLGRAMRRPLGA